MATNFTLKFNASLAAVLLSGVGLEPAIANDVKRFDIAARTVPCHGPFPMRCLVVNGKYFYDSIEGYKHREGKSATIYVIRKRRPEPVPADAGIYTYHKVEKHD